MGADGRLNYRLVVHGDHLVRTEFGDRPLVVRDDIWRFDWVLGGSVAFDRAKGELSGFSGDALRLGAFTRLETGLDVGDHLALFQLALDESWVGLEHAFGRGLPFQKLTDVVQAKLMYNYRLGKIAGPYVLGRVRTSFFPTRVYPERDVTVSVDRLDGTRTAFEATRGDEVSLMPAFGPTIAQGSAGMGFTLWDDDAVTLSVRAGLALRQEVYGSGARYIRRSTADTLLLTQLDSRSRWGGEASASLRVRLGGVLTLQSDFDGFLSYPEFTGDEALRPVFYWDSSASLALNTWASLVYQVTLHRDDSRLGELQLRQSLNLRFQYAIF